MAYLHFYLPFCITVAGPQRQGCSIFPTWRANHQPRKCPSVSSLPEMVQPFTIISGYSFQNVAATGCIVFTATAYCCLPKSREQGLSSGKTKNIWLDLIFVLFPVTLPFPPCLVTALETVYIVVETAYDLVGSSPTEVPLKLTGPAQQHDHPVV